MAAERQRETEVAERETDDGEGRADGHNRGGGEVNLRKQKACDTGQKAELSNSFTHLQSLFFRDAFFQLS